MLNNMKMSKREKKTLILAPLLNVLEDIGLMSFGYVFNLYHTQIKDSRQSKVCFR